LVIATSKESRVVSHFGNRDQQRKSCQFNPVKKTIQAKDKMSEGLEVLEEGFDNPIAEMEALDEDDDAEDFDDDEDVDENKDDDDDDDDTEDSDDDQTRNEDADENKDDDDGDAEILTMIKLEMKMPTRIKMTTMTTPKIPTMIKLEMKMPTRIRMTTVKISTTMKMTMRIKMTMPKIMTTMKMTMLKISTWEFLPTRKDAAETIDETR
jgi:hypothetical protein